MTRELRDYQAEAVAAIEEGWDGGLLRPAIVAATGLGKTDIIAALAAKRVRAGGRVLALAHRLELLDQITERCRMHLPERGPSVAGIVAGDLDQHRRPIVAAMVPTLRHPRRRERFEPFGLGDLVIVDECHHAGAKSYVDVLDWAGTFDETSGVQAFGVTATMYESGKKYRGLGDVWQKTVFERGLKWAIDQGWLVPLKGLAVVADHLDLSKVKTRAGDYSEEQIGELVAQDADQIIRAWCEHAEDRQTVGFFPTKESVEAARVAFVDHRCARHPAGVSCEVVLGDTTQTQRGNVTNGTGIYGRLARGDTRVMLGLMVPTEGWDCPPVSCVLMARPTKIDGLYQQMIGRGARLSPSTRKVDCLVLDVVGVTRTASLRTLTDLLPGVEYCETKPQACAKCGRFKHPEDRFEPRCICPPEERGIGDAIDLRGLKDPIPYYPVDLMATASAGAEEVLWLQTRHGIAFIPAGRQIVALMPEPGGTWKAGVVDRDDHLKKGVRLISGVGIEEAKHAAEWWVTGNVEATLWSRTASWRVRRQPGSDGQIKAAAAMGVEAPETYTKAALSDLLSIRSASRRLDRKGK